MMNEDTSNTNNTQVTYDLETTVWARRQLLRRQEAQLEVLFLPFLPFFCHQFEVFFHPFCIFCHQLEIFFTILYAFLPPARIFCSFLHSANHLLQFFTQLITCSLGSRAFGLFHTQTFELFTQPTLLGLFHPAQGPLDLLAQPIFTTSNWSLHFAGSCRKSSTQLVKLWPRSRHLRNLQAFKLELDQHLDHGELDLYLDL